MSDINDEIIACEWTLVFMLMFFDGDEHSWYQQTVDLAYSKPTSLYSETFWWSCRFFNPSKPIDWEHFRGYLDFKLRQRKVIT